MRELNQLQTIMQKQIEVFADNIFTSGTIISGCNFQFYKSYPYIKLSDTQLDGSSVSPGNYLGKFVKDDVSGLLAYVVNYADGFELSDPDKKTLYLKYINSGTDENTFTFSTGNDVTIYDGQRPVNNISVESGGSGFSNTDTVIISSALVVNVSLGEFTSSDFLINQETGANTEIVSVDITTIPGKAVLQVKPTLSSLTNALSTANSWSYSLYDVITNQSGGAIGTIEQILGENAKARIVTNSAGAVQSVVVTGGGKGYTYLPTVAVKAANLSATVSSLNLTAKNYAAKVKIPETSDAVGNGYAFGITKGHIYQLGHMLRVAPQTIIVEKYSSSPNNVVVGFTTVESIVDSTEDESLNENATGVNNEFAPGADRLKLVPTLTKMTKEAAASNTGFFALVEWNDGSPYKQNRVTQYSRIGDSIADNIYDSSGNFVMDAFQVTTETIANSSLEGTRYTVVVDPGQGYINGRKVQTLSNYKIDMQKGTDTSTANNIISLNYGNYLRVTELAGNFDFSAGDQVTFYDQPVNYVSNTSLVATGTITPQGAAIGTARIRSLELESGYPGTVSAQYRLYLFDIQMNSGKNFRNIKSVYYNDTYDGIADVILTHDATTNTDIAELKETKRNTLLFYAGVQSLKNSNTSTYTYRTVETINTTSSSATISKTLNDVNEFFPYTGDLSAGQMQEITVIPVEEAIQTANLAGTVNCSSSSNLVTGTSTALTDYAVGDYIGVTDGGINVATKRVTGVVNSTALQVDSVLGFTVTGMGHYRVFPKNLPVPFGQRTGLYANVDLATSKTLTLEFRHANGTVMTLDQSGAKVDTQLTYNVERRNVTSATKTANRNKYIKVALANNVGGTEGPWSIGVPDAFRLRGVYIANSSTVNTNSTDVTANFYIDHNQTANYMGLSYLYKRPQSSLQITADQYLLVCFDYFTRDDAGYFDTVSYLRTANSAQIANIESKTFNELSVSSAASSWEVPEVYTYDDKYYDLLNSFDFRPTVANTAAPNSNTASAPVNPTETETFSSISKFPRPNAVMRTQVEQYLGRIDDVYIAETGSIYLQKGIPDVNPRNRYQSNHPKDSLRLQTLVVPPYPNLCKSVRNSIQAIISTGIGNEKYLQLRRRTHTIEPLMSTNNQQTSQPMVYTMEDLANMDRRIKDLEYYQALSLLETNITNKIIPSSIDPTLNRFKFGFFADDFSTSIYSDTDNPQYSASIEFEGSDDFVFGSLGNPFEQPEDDGSNTSPVSKTVVQPTKDIFKPTNRLVSPKRIWSLRHYTENAIYIDEAIIEQTNATDQIDPCVVQDANTTSGNTYYTSVNRRVSTVYLEDLPGVVNIYFDIRAGAEDLGAKITVLNANNEVITSTNSAKQLTQNDKTFLSTNENANLFHTAISTSTYSTNFTKFSNPLIEEYGIGAGKLQISTQNGTKITIVVDSFDPAPNYKLLVEHPTVGQQNIINDPACDPNPPVYRGSLEGGQLTIQQWSCSNVFRVNTSGYKAFVINATGLKPSTVHKFYMDTEQWTNVILINSALYSAAQYEPRRFRGKGGAAGRIGLPLLVTSYNTTTNEVNRFFRIAMNRLYNSDGSPSSYTRLKTDKYGKISFLVFFPLNIAGWFSQDFNSPAYRLDYTGYNAAVYNGSGNYLKPTYGSSGYTALVLQDDSGQSLAARVFANRTPNKTIPADPRGNI